MFYVQMAIKHSNTKAPLHSEESFVNIDQTASFRWLLTAKTRILVATIVHHCENGKKISLPGI